MQYHKQRFFHMPEEGMVGDCYRTALGCLLDLAPEEVPHFLGDAFDFEAGAPREGEVDKAVKAFLASHGLGVFTIPFGGSLGDVLQSMRVCNPDMYYLVSGRSPRDVNHVVIGFNDAIVWDPAHPKPGESTEALVGPCSDGYHWVEVLVPLRIVNPGHYDNPPQFFEAPKTADEPQAEDDEDPSDRRERVSTLHRLNPKLPHQPGWWYYTPDGHAIGPFETEEEREKHLAEGYRETPDDERKSPWKCPECGEETCLAGSQVHSP